MLVRVSQEQKLINFRSRVHFSMIENFPSTFVCLTYNNLLKHKNSDFSAGAVEYCPSADE